MGLLNLPFKRSKNYLQHNLIFEKNIRVFPGIVGYINLQYRIRVFKSFINKYFIPSLCII